MPLEPVARIDLFLQRRDTVAPHKTPLREVIRSGYAWPAG